MSEKKYTPCGGCGATDPIQRCLGCGHPFRPIETPMIGRWVNLSENYTEDWAIMHCRFADDKYKLDTDLFDEKDGCLIKKGGTGAVRLSEVEYLVESESPAEQPVYTEQERLDTRVALRIFLKLFRNGKLSEQQEKCCANAEAILKKYSRGKIILKEKPSPWIAAETKPEHNVGVLVFIPGEDNHITSGMWDISNEWVLLDEYRTPEEEVTHWMSLPAFPEGYTWNEIPNELVDALKKVAKEELAKRPKAPEQPVREVEFAEWALREGWKTSHDGKGWMKHSDETPYVLTTKELYDLFKGGPAEWAGEKEVNNGI